MIVNLLVLGRPISLSIVEFRKIRLVYDGHSDELVAWEVLMRRDCDYHVAAVCYNFLDSVFLGVCWDKVQVLDCSVDRSLKFNSLRNQSYSSVLDPDYQKNRNRFDRCDEVDRSCQGRTVGHQLNLYAKNNKMISFEHVISFAFVPFCSVVRERTVNVNFKRYSMFFKLLFRQLHFKRNSFRIPVSNNQLPSFGFLVPKVAKIDADDICASLKLVIQQTLKSHIVDHYFKRNYQITVKFQKNCVSGWWNSYLFGSHV